MMRRRRRGRPKPGAGRPVRSMTACYHQACDTIDNVNRDMLNHYLQAIAGTLAHFATSTDRLR